MYTNHARRNPCDSSTIGRLGSVAPELQTAKVITHPSKGRPTIHRHVYHVGVNVGRDIPCCKPHETMFNRDDPGHIGFAAPPLNVPLSDYCNGSSIAPSLYDQRTRGRNYRLRKDRPPLRHRGRSRTPPREYGTGRYNRPESSNHYRRQPHFQRYRATSSRIAYPPTPPRREKRDAICRPRLRNIERTINRRQSLNPSLNRVTVKVGGTKLLTAPINLM